MEITNLYGLIGRNLSHSFSQKYFSEKFLAAGLDGFAYQNFEMENLSGFREIIDSNPNLKGLNVTIPYKEEIIPYLDEMSGKASKIGAVNTIRIKKKGKLKGYNTDEYGFRKSIGQFLKPHHKSALILGTGGAAKAIAYALEELDINYAFVSRDKENAIAYDRINATTFDNYQIIINCTPVGTAPHVDKAPEIPYKYFSERHIAFDLVYNPEVTRFLSLAAKHGATTINGYKMLVFQAEKAWKIWNK